MPKINKAKYEPWWLKDLDLSELPYELENNQVEAVDLERVMGTTNAQEEFYLDFKTQEGY
jgi:hypothetical protein